MDRIKTQEEIHQLIEEVFMDRQKISLEEFSEIVEKITSEMFLAVSFIFVLPIFLPCKYVICLLNIDCDPSSNFTSMQ
jgi:hypothetical protein